MSRRAALLLVLIATGAGAADTRELFEVCLAHRGEIAAVSAALAAGAIDEASAHDAFFDQVRAFLLGLGRMTAAEMAPGKRVPLATLRRLLAPIRSADDPPTAIRSVMALYLTRLDGVTEELQALDAGGEVDRQLKQRTRLVLRYVLSAEAYRSTGRDDLQDRLLLGLSYWLRRGIDSFDQLLATRGGRRLVGLAYVVLYGTVGVALLLALWLALRGRGRGADPVQTGAAPAVRPVAPAAEPDPAEWRGRALAAAQAGRWCEAVVAWHRYALHALARAGALELDDGKTNGEYVRALGGRSEATARAGWSLAARVDAVLYGGLPCTAADHEAACADAEAWIGGTP